jgi:hypothetical protein
MPIESTKVAAAVALSLGKVAPATVTTTFWKLRAADIQE